MNLDDKEQTLPQELVTTLFNAKFSDLSLPDTNDQLNRFSEHCAKRNINGKLIFMNMKLGIKFATVLADMLFEHPSLRVTHINLERNLLGDAGAIEIVKAISDSQVIIALNLSSNEIKPKGVNQIFNMLMSNESLQELTIGTTEGAMNLVNKSTRKVLEKFVVENQFLTVLSMRGM